MAEQREMSPSEKKDPIRYVEELAGPDDYWLSLTDAARVTRTSEPMVRRWASSGVLPIRKHNVGLNQRTRMVRASDLQRIRPIIDTSAAITDDVRKVDLVSIPRQQELLHSEQQYLRDSFQEVKQQVKGIEQAQFHLMHDLSAHQEQVGQRLDELTQQFQQQGERLQHSIEEMAQHQAARLEQISDDLTRQLATLREQQELQVRTTAHLHLEFQAVQQTQQQFNDHLQAQLRSLEEALSVQETTLRAWVEQQAATLSTSQQHLQETLQGRTEQIKTDLEAHIEQLRTEAEHRATDQARQITTLTQQQSQTNQRLTQAEARTQAAMSTGLGTQQRADRLQEQVENLSRQLEEERAARQAQHSRLEALEYQLTSLLQDQQQGQRKGWQHRQGKEQRQ